MKKLIALLMALILTLSVCPVLAEGEMTVEEIIAQAQTMTNEELYKKAIE